MIGLQCINNYKVCFNLKSLSTKCDIKNMLVSFESEFIYENTTELSGECIFQFPLDGDCVVYYFEACFDNKIVVGSCKEKEEAKNLYKAAKEKGQLTAMIERHHSMADVFTCKIGEIKSKSQVLIKIKFANELVTAINQDTSGKTKRFELVLPLILKPRYLSSYNIYNSSDDDYDDDDGDKICSNPIIFNYDLKAHLVNSNAIKDIRSVNYSLGVKYMNEQKTEAEVQLVSQLEYQKDIDLMIEYNEAHEPFIYYEFGTLSNRYIAENKIESTFLKPDVALINFLPTFDAELGRRRKVKFEVTFIVDRSGSMSGSSIDHAKECLLVLLKCLPINCKFQIYGFGSEFDKVFQNGPELYTETSLARGLEYQKRIKADFGGTEILMPLQDFYNNQADTQDDYKKMVFLLTDGEVYNQDEIIQLVRQNDARIFTVGIGDGVSTSLIESVAKSCGGRSIFVRNSLNLTEKVTELLGLAMKSRHFRNSKLEFKCPDNVVVLSVPSRIPHIFSDQYLTIFCLIKGLKEEQSIKCTLSGMLGNEEVKYHINITNQYGHMDTEFRAHRLLAKYKVDELTNEIKDAVNSKDKDTVGIDKTSAIDNLKKELIVLSIESNIVTDYTTFVAVDESEGDKVLINNNDIEEYDVDAAPCQIKIQHRLQIDLNRTFLYDEVDTCDFGVVEAEGCALADDLDQESDDYDEVDTSRSMNCRMAELMCYSLADDLEPEGCEMNDSITEEVTEKEEEKTVNNESTENVVLKLIGLQNFQGKWVMDSNLLADLNVDPVKMVDLKPDKIAANQIDVWMSIIICRYLINKQPLVENIWKLIVEKSINWIMDICYEEIDENFDEEILSEWFNEADKLL